MDAIILLLIGIGLLWTAFFGVIPPLIVGWFSFNQGKRGYLTAVKSRDAAFEKLDIMSNSLDPINEHLGLIHDSMTVLESLKEDVKDIKLLGSQKVDLIIPDEVLEKFRKSVIAGVKGSIGGMFSGQSKMVDAEIQELSEDIQNNMTDEEKEKLMIDQFKNAMFSKAMDWIKS